MQRRLEMFHLVRQVMLNALCVCVCVLKMDLNSLGFTRFIFSLCVSLFSLFLSPPPSHTLLYLIPPQAHK